MPSITQLEKTSDKARNETTSKQTRTSTNQEEKKRKQNAFPHNYK